MAQSNQIKITQEFASGIGAIRRVRPVVAPATLHLCLSTTPVQLLGYSLEKLRQEFRTVLLALLLPLVMMLM